MEPTLSLTLPSFGGMFTGRSWRGLLDLARVADEAGVDRLLFTDHVVMGGHLCEYPFGTFPFASDVDWLEPLTTIAALAGVTERIGFSTKILVAPLRPAALLAKTLATLDVLSDGRVEVGVGVGWQREEFEACGVDWDARGQALTDTVAACRALWTGGPVTFRSPTVSFTDVWCQPTPVRPGGVPVWFSGTLHRRNVERIVTLGDGWIPPPYRGPDELGPDVARLRAAWVAAGRPGDALQVQADPEPVLDHRGRPDIPASLAAAHPWLDAGATTVNLVLLQYAGRPERAQDVIPRLADAWRAVVAERQ